jgi:hypothetical protein
MEESMKKLKNDNRTDKMIKIDGDGIRLKEGKGKNANE